jgi:excisionase family DNA binding protein
MDIIDNQENKPTKASLMRVGQVAEYCGVSYCVVYRWITDEDLPVHRLPGSGIRPITLISREDLESFLARHRHETYLPREETVKLNGRRLLRRSA